MFPGMNPRKMQQMMRKMGVSQVDIPAKEVIIRTEDKELVFANPQVAKVNMMGQQTYQVIGVPEERPLSAEPQINEEDIKTVMEQADVDRETAEKAINAAGGDLAQAIINLQDQS